MGHHHGHEHNHSTENIKYAFFLNFIFVIIEIIGGLYTNSLAILADALHDLGDTFSLGLSWYLDKYSKKKRSASFSYGYKRFSLLAALINSIVLIVGSLFILTEVVPRILSPEPSYAPGMVVLAIFGVLVNGLAVLRLKEGKTLNERMVSWHLLEDVLGWVTVLIVSIIMMIWDAYILDPLLSLLITLYILWNVVKNFKRISMIFLQSIPEDININEIENSITKLSKVRSVHDTHIWTLDGEYYILTMHVVIEKNCSIEEAISIKNKVKKDLKALAIRHITVEIEYENEECISCEL